MADEKYPTAPDFPLISIGMPVYNEAAFLEETLTALLAQDYPRFEIIISDNASTDQTREICEKASEADARIRFSRFPENQGLAANWEWVFSLAEGKYFMWAGGHDLWSKNYLSQCAAMLEAHPEAAIAFGASKWIDSEGHLLAKEYGWTDTRGMDVISRYFAVLWGNVHPAMGLMRRAYWKQIPKIAPCPGGDLVQLTAMVLQGDFLHATEAVFFRREVRKMESHAERMRRYRSREYDSRGYAAARCFPILALPIELVRIVCLSALPFSDKALIILGQLASLPIRYMAGRKENVARLKLDGKRLL